MKTSKIFSPDPSYQCREGKPLLSPHTFIRLDYTTVVDYAPLLGDCFQVSIKQSFIQDRIMNRLIFSTPLCFIFILFVNF